MNEFEIISKNMRIEKKSIGIDYSYSNIQPITKSPIHVSLIWE